MGALFSALVDDPLEEDPPLEDDDDDPDPLPEEPLEDEVPEEEEEDSPLSDLEEEILEVSDPALPLFDEVMPAGQMLSTSTHCWLYSYIVAHR